MLLFGIAPLGVVPIGFAPLLYTCILALIPAAAQAARNSTLVVTTIINEPFVFMREDGAGYQGFIVDVLEHAASRAGFKYTLRPNVDGRYGTLQESGQWNGMIGELVRQEADIAAADLTITATRARVVNFAVPYATSRLTILTKKPDTSMMDDIGDIVRPLDIEVWFLSLCCCFLVAGVMSLIAVLSPWEKLGVKGSMLSVGGQGLTLPNSLLFAFSTVTWQGYHVTPRSVSGRTLAVSWWLFALLFLVTYSASLTSYFVANSSVPRIVSPINNFADMAEQTHVRYGAVASGSTAAFFQQSKIQIYQRIHAYMQASIPTAYVSTVSEGVTRVRQSKGDYAFIMEGITAQYVTTRMPCDLMTVGQAGPPRGYAFACQLGSPVCDRLSMAILEMSESGVLDDLRNRWFYLRDVCGPDESQSDRERGDLEMVMAQVSLKKFRLAYIILAVGTLLSLALLVAEIVWSKLRGKPSQAEPADDEIK